MHKMGMTSVILCETKSFVKLSENVSDIAES